MRVGQRTELSQPSQLSRRRRQVAAVCYRIRKRGIEFLLVQTRSGRWIFPKGGVEPGLTPAQSAALEAFEEAGVHGRMEGIAFARYFRRKADAAFAANSASASADQPDHTEPGVAAYLCEVSRLEAPQESNRNPTWFSTDKAKQRLLKDRAAEFGTELARVVDRAVARIRRLRSASHHTANRAAPDSLQKVQFEAHEDGRLHEDVRKAVLARYFLRPFSAQSPAIEAAVQARMRKVSQIGGNKTMRGTLLRLGSGTVSIADAGHNITAIDSERLPASRGRKSR